MDSVDEKRPKRATSIRIVLLTAAVIPAQPALAGGYLLQEQSPKEIGRAFSGAAASADGPSTIFYNPAGMTELEGLRVSMGGTLLFVDSKQQNTGTTRSGPGATPTQAMGGGNGGNPFAPVIPVPTSYASWQAGDSGLWLGLGISSPFGLKLRYDEGYFGRYESLYSNLLTVNVQPSAAYKVSDALSIGGGIDIQYADVTLTNAAPPLDPAGTDGLAHLSGDDVAVGWNAGLLVKLDGGTRLGLHYRSRVKHKLKGSYDISGLTGALAAANGSFAIESPLTLPDIATASISVPVDDKTRLMLTGRYYNWSLFRNITLRFANGATGQKDYHYKDSWSLSAGIERKMTDRLTLRMGTMFDKTPTNEAFLSTRVPDGNRTWASAGLGYALSSHLTLDASYAHVFVNGQSMSRTETFYSGAAATTVTTVSRNSGNVDMIATSVTARF